MPSSTRRLIYLCGLVLLVFSISQPTGGWVPALQETSWSTPQTIPAYDVEAWPPILVADQNRTVHAFSSQWTKLSGGGSVFAVVYNQWSLKSGWTPPVDILISPVRQARVTDVYLDSTGMIHLVFWGGDNTDANIYYSKVPVTHANEASAWSQPRIIAYNAGDPENAVFAADQQGTLYVIFNGRKPGSGIYVISSKDDGETWSNPIPIFFTRNDEPNMDLLTVIVGQSGWIHAIWNVYNYLGQGRGTYYSRSQDGVKWSEPTLLAEAQAGLGTQTPMIAEYNHTLIFLYNVSIKLLMRRSTDDGKTWDDPALIFPRHVGVNGRVSMVVDGNNTLHLFFGQRISGKPDIHGMWHSTYVDNRWTEPEALVKGPRGIDDTGKKSFDPFEARAVVSQGNTLLVTWRTDPGLVGNGIWYSYKVLNIPESPVVQPFVEPEPLPSPTSAQGGVVNPAGPAATATLFPIDRAALDDKSRPVAFNLQCLLAPGVAMLVILIFVLTRAKNQGTRL